MKFIKADDDVENGYFHVWKIELPEGRFPGSEDKTFYVAALRVIFGYRVVGYYGDDVGPTFNWCCGNNIALLAATHKSIKTIIEQGCPIKSIRRFSNIKPWPLDTEFVEYFKNLADNYGANAPVSSSPGDSTHH